jgi:hypothetical protein
MKIACNVAEVLDEHVTLELECIDRVFLNLYVPMLQSEAGVAWFWRHHRGHQFASSALMATMTKSFIRRIEAFAQREGIDLITFRKGQRKEDIAHEYLASFGAEEGVLFIGKAQEKASVVRTERRTNPRTGQSYAWLVKSSAPVNHYYFYCVDRHFGPFFIKFCSYFPYNGRLCCNGHEYLKRQLDQRDITFEALDNSIVACADAARMQKLADALDEKKLDALARRWFRRLPHPFPDRDRAADFRYEVSILQAEFALTQVFDRPLTGRIFFEQVIRENLDLGRPDRVQLIFDRRVTRCSPGRFRTRVITEGVVPSLYVDYKSSRIKQYHKEGRALRTETTINNARDFEIGKRLHNLPRLRKVGFQANQRLLRVQRISHDCSIGEEAFQNIIRPAWHDGQYAAGLRFGDPRVLALLAAIVSFRLLPRGFSNRDLREYVAPLLGIPLAQMTQGKMTYDLRRLRVHGFIERIPRSHRYRVNDVGFRSAFLITRAHARLLRPGLSVLGQREPPLPAPLRNALTQAEQAIERSWQAAA